MPELPLYQDHEISISLLKDPEGKILGDEHEVLFCEPKQTRYILQRHVLETLANSPRPRLLERLETMHPGISYDLEQRGLTSDSVGFALCQAYIEEERRFE